VELGVQSRNVTLEGVCKAVRPDEEEEQEAGNERTRFGHWLAESSEAGQIRLPAPSGLT
jgi:hypothetical protein